jgi:CRISPR-associated protein Cmr1
MTMIQLRYRLTLLTPAFLGNAHQAGQWRTPPIKALLRQWWRVAYMSQHSQSSVAAMREAEGRLFGHAWLEGDSDQKGGKVAARQSEVRLRLSNWGVGSLNSWEGLEQRPVNHPEVERTGGKVGPHVYLGFGPLTVEGRTTALTKGRAAIQAADTAELSLAAPAIEIDAISQSLALIHRFGALGGRSRNGWGSVAVSPAQGTPALAPSLDPSLVLLWTDAIRSEWPQAIGRDDKGPLIWQTEPVADWKLAMRRLAEVKISVRRQFLFTSGRDAPSPEDRHWLSYPVTNHSVRAWGGNARLPNSLRFKVRADGEGRMRGVIFHMPCLPPPAFQPDPSAIRRLWRHVHEHLDAKANLQRIPG